jgi:hypothetical protein
MPWLEPVTLTCEGTRLEPLTQSHRAELSDAVGDGELWNLWYTTIPRPEEMGAEIERLGAKLDGVLRQLQRAADGKLRDTCVYSIIHSEWPSVKAHLRWQLTRPRPGT